eukprot:7976251-Pyramimonas_sp.AAC.1
MKTTLKPTPELCTPLVESDRTVILLALAEYRHGAALRPRRRPPSHVLPLGVGHLLLHSLGAGRAGIHPLHPK